MVIYMTPLLLLLALYFFPALVVCFNRNATWEDRVMVAILNLLFGWTILGWMLMLGLAGMNFKYARRLNQAKANFYLRQEALFNPAPAPPGFPPSRPADTTPSC